MGWTHTVCTKRWVHCVSCNYYWWNCIKSNWKAVWSGSKCNSILNSGCILPRDWISQMMTMWLCYSNPPLWWWWRWCECGLRVCLWILPFIFNFWHSEKAQMDSNLSLNTCWWLIWYVWFSNGSGHISNFTHRPLPSSLLLHLYIYWKLYTKNITCCVQNEW